MRGDSRALKQFRGHESGGDGSGHGKGKWRLKGRATCWFLMLRKMYLVLLLGEGLIKVDGMGMMSVAKVCCWVGRVHWFDYQ